MKDMSRLIEQVCTRDRVGVTGSHVTVDTARRYQLLYRYNYVRHSLRPFGYDFDFHPLFAARLVLLLAWLSGNALVSIDVVTLRRARLVLRWVTVYERVNHFGM